jgi:DNA-binding beta-propeller fold protein YncE
VRRLERKWERELVVIGVHSPKFIGERDTESVRRAILRLEVGHPVVNDRDFRVWRAYAARAWPTVLFIDPRGTVIGKHEGEFPFEAFDRLIGEMVAEFDGAGLIDRRPFDRGRESDDEATPLRFPGKVIADETTQRLIISDSGHHRIVVADLDGRVQQVIGSGVEGRDDGPSEVATFSHPQGLALDGTILYVADTENHALRAVDLVAGTVTTVAGTGEQLMGARVGGPALQTPLASPWDLALLDDTLYVAMAGTHQLWSMRLGSGFIVPHTGNGREDLVDGPLGSASMNQPSGLVTDGARLWVADAEASAVRVVELTSAPHIRTVIGEGLFEFGDRDGRGPSEVRLQHPVGITWHAGTVYVADTYNHKIKRLDPDTGECCTWLGRGEPGADDGAAETAAFSEPSGLAVAAGRLYVADTNNHVVRFAELDTGLVSTLLLLGLPPR